MKVEVRPHMADGLLMAIVAGMAARPQITAQRLKELAAPMVEAAWAIAEHAQTVSDKRREEAP